MATDHLIANGTRYYSLKDERAFFKWLLSIRCVDRIHGRGASLFIYLKREPKELELRELLALFYRFGVDMRQLARFVTDENESWFRSKRAYWFKHVFGARKRPAG